MSVLQVLERQLNQARAEAEKENSDSSSASNSDFASILELSVKALRGAQDEAKREAEQAEAALRKVKEDFQTKLETAEAAVKQAQSELRGANRASETAVQKAADAATEMAAMRDKMRGLKDSLQKEQRARVQAETRLEGMSAMYETARISLEKMQQKPQGVSVPQAKMALPVGYTFEIKRRADGLATIVIATPTT